MPDRKLRSNFTPGTTPWAMRRAQWTALGLTEADLEKPKIAIVNSSSSRRRAELPPLAAPAGCGWLSIYARTVAPLGRGATLSSPAAHHSTTSQ